jgi:uncharacterized membrane-anchored protein YitT (DUF2179 family)
MAIGIGVFLVDAKVVPGGVSGLSMSSTLFNRIAGWFVDLGPQHSTLHLGS